MLSDVPLMDYLGWNWIPFPNGLLIACFWFYRLLRLTHNSSHLRAHSRAPCRRAGSSPAVRASPQVAVWPGMSQGTLGSLGWLVHQICSRWEPGQDLLIPISYRDSVR